MKNFLIFVCVIIAFMAVFWESPQKSSYSEAEIQEAIADAEHVAYKRGFDEGYDLAKYEDKAELEKYDYYLESAYDAGYEEGYGDCLVEHGLDDESSHGSGWIKKDK